MSGRFSAKTVVITGAGTSGPGVGNGKAASVLYARDTAHAALFLASDEARYVTCTTLTVDGGLTGSIR